jgi:hypothetical protein
MPALEEIRASLRRQLTGHKLTDDTRLEEPFIDYIIRSKRSVLIRDQAKPGLGVSAAYYQDMSCLKVETAKIVCDGRESGIEYQVVEVPQTESIRGAVAYLGLVNGTEPFQELGLSSFLMATGGRMCRTRPSFTMLDGKAYLKFIPDNLKVLRMIAILENPAENRCILDFDKTDYPIPNDKIHQLEVLCLKQLLSTNPIQGDTINDGSDFPANTERATAKNIE